MRTRALHRDRGNAVILASAFITMALWFTSCRGGATAAILVSTNNPVPTITILSPIFPGQGSQCPGIGRVLAAGIQERYPRARQVVVAEEVSEVFAFPLLRLGAKGLPSFAEAHHKLAEALRVLAAVGFWVPRDLLSLFTDSTLGTMHARHVKASPANLSQREREVLDALLENLANKEIGDKLDMSERTVKFHVSSLLEKFSERRRTDLILLCFQDRSPGHRTVLLFRPSPCPKTVPLTDCQRGPGVIIFHPLLA